jgi:hypothetical protein
MSESLEEQWRYLKEKSWDGGEEEVRQATYLNRKVSMENKPRYHTRENHEYLEKLLGVGHCIYCLNKCRILEKGEAIKEP